MIAKHVPMRSLGKSNFGELVEYITDAQDKEHRLGQVQITNCVAAFLRDAITEVLATQHMNKRAKGDKTYHLLLSFRAGEHPSAETLRAIEERICGGLGYAEHQRISAVHADTDNLHIHIAINKIHPARHTMHEPYYPHRALAELCATLERDYGLEADNHMPHRRGAESRAADMERHAGVESLVGWIKRECLDEIKGAQSWRELHQVVSNNGLSLRVRGHGLVFEAGDGTMVKASTVAREFSKPRLENRFGPFEASPLRQPEPTPSGGRPHPARQDAAAEAVHAARKPVARVGRAPPPSSTHRLRPLSALASVHMAGGAEAPPPGRQYRKDPIRLRVDTAELYARYKAAQQALATARSDALRQVRHRKDRQIEAAKRAGRLRRAAIKLVGESRANKKLLHEQASRVLRGQIQAINKQFQQERAALYAEHSRRAWADWLKQEAQRGSVAALAALRAREAAQGLKGNTITGEGQAKLGPDPVVDNITKKGTIIFRAGMSAVRDDGDRLQVSRETTQEGLKQALRLAMERYGARITVNGTVGFKAQLIRAAADSQLPITFADPAMEARRQALLPLTKANTHERAENPEHRGRVGRGAGGLGQRPIADEHAARTSVVARDGRPLDRHRPGPATGPAVIHRKPDIGRLGRVPPPQGQHRLRALSELGVVRIAGGSEVLLPRDVPRHLEQQGAQSDHALRRGIPRPGAVAPQGAASEGPANAAPSASRPEGHPPPKLPTTPPGLLAADKYIAERESKRLNGFDIPKHARYTAAEGELTYAGTRRIDGCALALLQRGGEVMVWPVDEATARRLSRIAIGSHVAVTPTGSIRTRGRGR